MNSTYITFNFYGPDDEILAAAQDIARLKAEDVDNVLDSGFETKWSNWEADLCDISRRHPSVLIAACFDGEGSSVDEHFAARFRGGECEAHGADIRPFTTILYPLEERGVFANAMRAYNRARAALPATAARRLRALKDTITGHVDATLDVSAVTLSRHLRMAVLRDGRYDDVTAIAADGRTLSTDNTPIAIDDLNAEALAEVVAFGEELCLQKEAGILCGIWDEAASTYRLSVADAA